MKQLFNVLNKIIVVQIILLALLLYTTTYALSFPEVDSKIVEVYDMTEGKILYEKNSKNITSIASLTKLYFVILPFESCIVSFCNSNSFVSF